MRLDRCKATRELRGVFAPNNAWRLAQRFALVLAPIPALAQPTAQTIDDARFRDIYQRRYEALAGVAPDIVVMELRDRVELVASGGSHVGAASNQRRVRGFESVLLQGLQTATCRGAAEGPARPSPTIVEKVGAAASAQGLRAEASDLAELSALAQQLLDNQPRERLCALKSLDDVR